MAIETEFRTREGAVQRPPGTAELEPAFGGAIALPVPDGLKPRAEVRGARGRQWLIHRALVLADVIGLSLAFVLSQYFFRSDATADVVSPAFEAVIFAAMLPIWIVMAHLSGLYGRGGQRADHSTADDAVGVFAVITIGVWLLFSFSSLTHAVRPDAPRMVALWVMAVSFVILARAVARGVARRSPLFWENAVIMGAGDVGQLIARKLQQHPEYGIRLVGFVDDSPRDARQDLHDRHVLGSPDRLPELVERFNIDRVIIAYSTDTHEQELDIIRRLRAAAVRIDLVPRLFEAIGPKVEVHAVENLPLIGLPRANLSPSARVVKRSIDIIGATIGLILTAPLFGYIALRIKLDSPGPVFFRQTRLGFNMKEFTALKFRTMRADVDDSAHREYVRGSLSWKDPIGQDGTYKPEFKHQVTSFGRGLRRTSLDELPQLINVLKGDMSLVGPRPCIPYETEHFAPHHFERFLVPAGLTGLWQVAARSSSSFGEALEMDVAYARSWSLGLDLRLLCRTPFAVVRQRSSTT